MTSRKKVKGWYHFCVKSFLDDPLKLYVSPKDTNISIHIKFEQKVKIFAKKLSENTISL